MSSVLYVGLQKLQLHDRRYVERPSKNVKLRFLLIKFWLLPFETTETIVNNWLSLREKKWILGVLRKQTIIVYLKNHHISVFIDRCLTNFSNSLDTNLLIINLRT